MALPASWLARKLGYKGGIISGLLLVSLGRFGSFLLQTSLHFRLFC
jgi:fucose permease